jgi:AraC family transcriptional regulator of adaptative response/methylated-DNA-[protein]-cysteine methyltransferase
MNAASKQEVNREMNNAPTNSTATDEEKLWQAILARDSQLDGKFIFAVSSTMIFCRPSCPSRRPKREHVSFFLSPAAAEQAGFRACLRCHPKDAAIDPQIELVQRACRFIEQHGDETITLEALGEHVGLSPFHLQRTFKKHMGITPRQYALSQRASSFKTGVRAGESLTSAMYEAGYGSSSRLYERAGAELGMTPASYSRGGAGAKISYTVAGSPLGRLLVAGTEKGICAVRLGDSDETLESGLRTEFPAATLERHDGQLRDSVSAIVKHLEGKQPNLNLPLDIQATAFQRLVWETLQAIPYGSTRSYAEVAKAIGRPSAVRAVARACATNPVALVVPCHRVIGSDKRLTGYRWGLERKQQLLAKEARNSD